MKERKKNIEHTVVVSQEVFRAIKEHIGNHSAERGGMLGRNSDGVIRHYEPDYNGRCNTGAYDPDISHLNGVIKTWKKSGIEFCGFAHSHPPGICQPSGHDKWYAGEILAAFKKLDILVLPIIQTVPDTGGFNISPFVAVPDEKDRKSCKIMAAELRMTDANENEHRSTVQLVDSESRQLHRDETASDKGKIIHGSHMYQYFGHFEYLGYRFEPQSKFDPQLTTMIIENARKSQYESVVQRDKYMTRICNGVDKDLLDRTRLVVIGTGGAASLIRNCARMGFGEFVLIDPDVVSETNIATQQAEPNDIGLFKVETLGRDIVHLNPGAAALTIAQKVEMIDDVEFHNLFRQPLRDGLEGHNSELSISPHQTILMVLTDDFWAQARGHRLGLHFGLPTICAQEYHEGRGAEVTYTVSEITPACHRCITASRYKAYLDEGYKNDVTSEDAPIFAAEMLNATLGHMVLAISHHGSKHSRWGNLIQRIGNRNLIQLRMDPDFDTLFGDKFTKRLEGAKDAASFLMLDSLFLAQTPDFGQSANRPICPDCGGTGDLRESIGKFHDTRKMLHNVGDRKNIDKIVQPDSNNAIGTNHKTKRE